MQRNKEEESHYRQLLGLTSLTAREFSVLLAEFDKLWQVYHQRYDLKGKARMVTKFKEHAAISLRGSQDKLLFILVYMQQNPTGISWGNVFHEPGEGEPVG